MAELNIKVKKLSELEYQITIAVNAYSVIGALREAARVLLIGALRYESNTDTDVDRDSTSH